MTRRRRKRCAVGRRRQPMGTREARRERADAAQPDLETDRHHGPVGRAKQRRCPLEAAGQEIRVRRLAVRAPELPAEMGLGQSGRGGQIRDSQRLRIPAVDEIPCPQKMALRRDDTHAAQYRARCSGWAPRRSRFCAARSTRTTGTAPADTSRPRITSPHEPPRDRLRRRPDRRPTLRPGTGATFVVVALKRLVQGLVPAAGRGRAGRRR